MELSARLPSTSSTATSTQVQQHERCGGRQRSSSRRSGWVVRLAAAGSALSDEAATVTATITQFAAMSEVLHD